MLCSTVNLRVLRACVPFIAPAGKQRSELQGVLLELDETGATYVAMDGHRMIAFRDDLAPNLSNPGAPNSNYFIGQFVIPPSPCEAFKLAPDDDVYAKIFGEARLTIAYGLTDITFCPIDAALYPSWRHVAPHRPPSGVLAQFNLKKALDFRKFGETMGLSEPHIAHNGDGPAPVWYPGYRHAFGVVMPIKSTDEAGRTSPPWARRDAGYRQTDIEDAKIFHITPVGGEQS